VTLVFRYAACTHIGLVSSQNEDSGYASPQLIAVADGMGGHVFGEVASAITVATVHEFDAAGHIDSVPALRNVMTTANARLADRIRRDPRLDGMGTTLTALLLLGDHEVGLIHIGDSRAYRLRNGKVRQLSHDHTLVQALVDEGRLTEEQARKHPYRNMITRVMQGLEDTEPDLGADDVEPGDRLLVCSDGLPDGPVSDEAIERALKRHNDPQQAAQALVDLALKAGGPDNVTCVVADVIETDDPAAAHHSGADAVVVGAAADPNVDIDGDTPTQASLDPISNELAGDIEDEDDEQLRYAPRAPRRFRWLLRGLLLLVLLGALGAAGVWAYNWTQRQYYIGTAAEKSPTTGQNEEHVAIYRGLSQQLPGLDLSDVVEVDPLLVSSLPEYHRRRISETIPADDLADAKRIVDQLEASVSSN
jgi:serine/threonine protein phosphatase PrpC